MLVEVKSARPSQGIRVGSDDGSGKELQPKVAHAAKQIAMSARLVRDRHPASGHIPADRPLVGLVVTLEPFHLRQTQQLHLLEQPELPVGLAWAHDLEGVVGGLCDVRDAGALLLAALRLTDPQERDLRSAAGGYDAGNPILQDAWDRLGALGPINP